MSYLFQTFVVFRQDNLSGKTYDKTKEEYVETGEEKEKDGKGKKYFKF